MKSSRDQLKRLRDKILHNWYLKLFSIVCAVILWAVAYNIENPVTSTRFANVQVTFVNTDVLEENGQVYTVLNNSDVVRTVTVSASRTIIDDISDSDIEVLADFSKMRLDGTVDLTFTCSKYEGNVTFTASSSTLQLEVENKMERYLRLTADVTGTAADGYIISGSTIEQNQLSVSGPESIVSSIATAKASVVLEDATENIVTYADIVLYDSDGNEISQDRLTLGSSRVRVTVEVLKTNTVPLIVEAEVTPASGYLLNGEMTADTTEITLAGKSGVIDLITEVVISGDEYIVTDATEDVVFEIDVDDYLPSGVTRADESGNGVVTVTQLVEEIYEKEITLDTSRIEIANVPEGYIVEIAEDAQATVVISGLQADVEEVRASDITAAIDVEAWMEDEGLTSLTDGRTYEVDVEYTINSENVEIVSGSSIGLLVTEETDEEE
ncbi:MAG: hypothetical protein LUC90_08585 [Lachnospiraceae bacterium]|nr:hypothetical protein [Lachnospiraceae bacterium]